MPVSIATVPQGSSGWTWAAEHGARRLIAERLLGDHLRAGGVGLLRGLEDRKQRRREAPGERRRRARQGDECSQVDVVPAGVHRSRRSR